MNPHPGFQRGFTIIEILLVIVIMGVLLTRGPDAVLAKGSTIEMVLDRPVLFEDEELNHDRKTRDPVAPAQASPSVQRKKFTKLTPDGFQVHSFETLLESSTAPDVVADVGVSAHYREADPATFALHDTQPVPAEAPMRSAAGELWTTFHRNSVPEQVLRKMEI